MTIFEEYEKETGQKAPVTLLSRFSQWVVAKLTLERENKKREAWVWFKLGSLSSSELGELGCYSRFEHLWKEENG